MVGMQVIRGILGTGNAMYLSGSSVQHSGSSTLVYCYATGCMVLRMFVAACYRACCWLHVPVHVAGCMWVVAQVVAQLDLLHHNTGRHSLLSDMSARVAM